MPDRWQYGNSSIATIQMKLISQRKCTVLSLRSPSLKLFMKPQTPIATGRAVTSSWRATVGCVTQGRRTLCQLTKLGGYWIRPIYISIALRMCFIVFFQYFYDRPDWSISLVFTVRRRPQVDIEEYNFLERIFAKSKPEERTWAKFVNLNTVHWYCDEPEPTPVAIKYEERTRQRKSVNFHL